MGTHVFRLELPRWSVFLYHGIAAEEPLCQARLKTVGDDRNVFHSVCFIFSWRFLEGSRFL